VKCSALRARLAPRLVAPVLGRISGGHEPTAGHVRRGSRSNCGRTRSSNDRATLVSRGDRWRPKVTLRAAAPGIFFALIGASVAVYALSRGAAFREGMALKAPTTQIIEKVVAGQSLEDRERLALKEWFELTRRRARSSDWELGWIRDPPRLKEKPEG